MLDYPTLHQALRAEQEQIQLLLTLAAHCKAMNDYEDRQKKPNSQNATQQMENKHELDTEVNTTAANEEEMSDEEADISRPPIDLWKPLGQIGDSSFDSLEHHPDTSIALNVNNDVRLQSLSPDMIFFDDLPDLPSPPLTHALQQSCMSFCPLFQSKLLRYSYMHLTPKSFIQKVHSNAHYARSRNPPASPCPTEVATKADIEVSSSNDHVANMSDSFRISDLPILTSPQSSDDSVIPQFNDDEDAAYLKSNDMEDHPALNGSTIIVSDKRRLQEKGIKIIPGTITYRGYSPGGTSVDIIEVIDSPSPPAISHNDYINDVASDEQVNNEDLSTESFHDSHSVSEEFATMDESEDAVATDYKPLAAKRLRYYRNGLGRSYAKRMNTKLSTRGWIKRKP
ncbi:unnamed protein product [Umbelopsis ramanniana]